MNEAARILAEIGANLSDERALEQGCQKLAEALEAAERRGHVMTAEQKQQSG
ncbi:hypothetical protein ACFOYU_21220 [Microvirga sp. GCM10011540]|uniref:hypothetical protein n=1 Tax=Microvirga sp. GCM10011540 TaxID=3317338 RepID=UPI00360DA87E